MTGQASRGACVPCTTVGLPDTRFHHAAQADSSHIAHACPVDMAHMPSTAWGGRSALSATVLRPPDMTRTVMGHGSISKERRGCRWKEGQLGR